MRNSRASKQAYADVTMFRREPNSRPSAVSDRELGVAALLLLLAVVLTTIVVPGLS